jgi:cytochrome c
MSYDKRKEKEDSMKMMMVCLMILAGASSLWGAEKVSVDRGMELFESTRLGKSGKSCATCHPGGRKLEWAATYEEEKIAQMINVCIQKALQGKPLPVDSDDMKSFVMYLKTFAGP